MLLKRCKAVLPVARGPTALLSCVLPFADKGTSPVPVCMVAKLSLSAACSSGPAGILSLCLMHELLCFNCCRIIQHTLLLYSKYKVALLSLFA